MNELEKQLLREESGGAQPRLIIRSHTRVDTGRWGHRSPVWLCVMANELIVLAVSRRRYIEHVPFAECRDSRYRHASGELVLAPVETLQFNRFRMSPRDALDVLKIVRDADTAPGEPAIGDASLRVEAQDSQGAVSVRLRR